MPQATPNALVTQANPARRRLEALRRALAQRRDAIAEADLAITSLKSDLVEFTGAHHRALAVQHEALGRVLVLLRHIERWMHTLSVYTLRATDQARLMDRLDTQRRAALRRLTPSVLPPRTERRSHESRGAKPKPVPPPAPRRSDGPERLKRAFRALARRYHPDLADNEVARADHGDRMARINALYAQSDVVELEAMAAQVVDKSSAKNAAAPPPAPDPDGDLVLRDGNHALQLAQAEERLARFDAVLESMHEELAALRSCPTHALWLELRPRGRRTEAAIYADLCDQSYVEMQQRLADIPRAMRALEACVQQYNDDEGDCDPGAEGDLHTLDFDPYVDQDLARLSLSHLAALRPSARVAALSEEIENIAEHQPAVARLILLAFVAQKSPRPLPGLESYEAIAERLEAAGRRDVPPMDLAEALIAADGLVEYGPRRDPAGSVQMALIFRAQDLAQAIPLTLRQFTMRQLFRQVLLHLGRAMRCGPCARRIFAVPLFRLRGLDHLRALVCPHCGTTQTSYFLPKGRDIQTVLNAAYLELDLVHEFTCTLARTSIGLQLLPVEEANMTVGALRKRLHQEVFARHGLPVLLRQLLLVQDNEVLRDSLPLTELLGRRLQVELAQGTPLGEAAALETLRYRIRSRFRQSAPAS